MNCYIREMDELGRIVIPFEMRMNWKNNGGHCLFEVEALDENTIRIHLAENQKNARKLKEQWYEEQQKILVENSRIRYD